MVRSFESQGRSFSVDGGALNPVAAAAVDIVDDFERASLDHYFDGTSDWSITTNQSFNGTRALELTTETAFSEIWSDTGLDNYPSKGTRFKVYSRFNTADAADDNRIVFGADTANDPNANHFRIEIGLDSNDDMNLVKNLNGSGSFPAQSSDGLGWSADTWYEFDVTWDDGSGSLTGTNDNIVITATDMSDDTEHASISAVDSDHASFDGIGLSAAGMDTTGDAIWYDYWHIVETA